MLIVVVMTVTAGFFIRGLAASRLMQQRQSAVAVAEQAMERVRGQRVSVMEAARDNPPVTGETDPAYRVGNIDYTVATKIEDCWMPPAAGECGPDSSSPNILM